MVWYNPLSRFKNTPTKTEGQRFETPTVNTGDVLNDIVNKSPDTSIDTGTLLSGSNNTITTGSTTTTSTYNPTWIDKALDAIIPITDSKGIPIGTQSKLESTIQTNQDATHQVEGFSLDPYNVTKNNTDKPIQGTVTTEGKDATKTWREAMQEANNRYGYTPSRNPFANIKHGWDIIVSAAEQKYPSVGAYNVGMQSSEAFGGELAYKHPRGVTYIYDGVDKTELEYDINKYFSLKEAYDKGEIGKYVFESAVDELYETYKNNFKPEIYNDAAAFDWLSEQRGIDSGNPRAMEGIDWRSMVKMSPPGISSKDGLDRGIFIQFLENERNKIEFQQGEYDERLIDVNSDQSRARVAEGYQYAINVIGPSVQNSNFSSAEAAKEFMNDSKAILINEIGRWDSAMTQTYRVKAWMQRQFNTDDMYSIDPNSIDPMYRDIYYSIQINEQNYNQFVKNLAKYISWLPSYVDPNTGKLDGIPDAVIDPEDGKMKTYYEVLFDGISVVNGIGGNTYLFQENTSPIDMLRKSSAQIQNAKAFITESSLGYLWDNFQYNSSSWIGAPVNEVSQQTIGWVLDKGWNILSKESGEIPFEFVDMDTSMLSTITTNKSQRGRLMQTYAAKTTEYVPELVGNIIEAYLLDKELSKMGTAAQLGAQNWLGKRRLFNSTLLGRQLNYGLSYTFRAAQRLGTDQLIDAALSIGDMEPGSEISKKLSIGGTLIGEGLGILSDLKVLGRSFSNYFRPDGIKYGGITDPIKLMYDNPGILDDYAASLGKGTVDESGKITGDEYKLLIQDLSDYSKYMKKVSDSATDVVRQAIKEGVDLKEINMTFKQAVYDVMKQVYAQDSAMARAITNILTDERANIADMIKYIGRLDGTIKIGPFISSIKVADKTKTFVEKVVKNYNRNMDLIVSGGLVAGINRGLTRQEVESLVKEGFLKSSAAGDDVASVIDDFFIPLVVGDEVKYFPTDKGLKALGVETSVINAPLAIVAMTDDTKALIEKLKSLPPSQRKLSNNLIDGIGETNSIDRLAENIAGIDYLNICK